MQIRSLPITNYKDKIIKTINDNKVTIFTADTGAGKSTQIPKYLLEAGYRVLVTQPRILAAISLAERVSEELGTKVGELVGYNTANRKAYSRDTKITFCTDGLALITELLDRKYYTILVLDEVHEFNLNIETLLAYSKLKLKNNEYVKVVIMSATIEADRLSEYFNNAPIISVPGKLYPVQVIKASDTTTIELEAKKYIENKKNILIFQPGKEEISTCITILEKLNVNDKAVILPLHGELESEEQHKCFEDYDVPKIIVATNIAQTSITIDGTEVVLDTGTEKRMEIRNGVDSLCIESISKSDALQRQGRAGRTCPGIYVDFCKDEDRLDYAKPEILRRRLDSVYLSLAKSGFDMEELEFFHQPDKNTIHETKVDLINMELLNSDSTISDLGKDACNFPLDTRFSRMLLEAIKLDVLDDMITIVSIFTIGEITERPKKDKIVSNRWKYHYCSEEVESDILGQLAVYKAVEDNRLDKKDMIDKGINRKQYFKVRELRNHLIRILQDHFYIDSTGNREDIIKCMLSGLVDFIYYKDGYNNVTGKQNEYLINSRRINKNSLLVRNSNPGFIIGIPIDREFIHKEYNEKLTIKLLSLPTIVNIDMLKEINNPDIFEIKIIDNYDARWYRLVKTTEYRLYNKVVYKETRNYYPADDEYQEYINNNKLTS